MGTAFNYGTAFFVGEKGVLIFDTLGADGLPVGLFEGAAYDVGTVTVPAAATVLIYTDGVIEARNASDEEFGLSRLINVFATTRDTVRRLVGGRNGRRQHLDQRARARSDITLMALAGGDD